MAHPSRIASRKGSIAALLVGTATLLVVVQPPAAADHQTVTAVRGSAYGYSMNVGLFAGPPTIIEPTPIVTLPEGGSVIPVTATAPDGRVAIDPAIFFSSGPITVTTQGTTGPAGVGDELGEHPGRQHL